MDNKERYRKFCESEQNIPIFSQYWWLNAVAKDTWDVILYEKEGNILASMVYVLERTPIGIRISKALLTQNNGVYIKYSSVMKQASKLSYEQRVMDYIIDELEKLPIYHYEQNFHYQVTNWLPFYFRGYKETTRYTYVIEDTSNLSEVEKNFTSGLRYDLKKARKNLIVQEDIPIEEFYRINEMSFTRKGKTIPYTCEQIKLLDNAARQNNACKSVGVYDEEKNLLGVSYFVWDANSVYYIMGGGNPKYISNQPQSLCIFEGIKLANQLGKKFDFEGSMLPNIEKNFRKYGGVQKPYFRIWKDYDHS